MIYESPDGGKTVYSRLPGSKERKLIFESDEVRVANRWVKLQEAVKLAESEPSLDDAIRQVEILYNLLK